ncbi:FHA domain-containing protein [Gloeobacter morelensis]|uniref:FHA domain-containing protein n=1 Tax=Gloeobacter morelensis MG652769 TaxID=2781736 RepID=A0ABY3PPU4_9CYAN|nr:FHA domain-containing protein [Gloeobacter morelensis]UFP95568.1 FHA domain-containing protein [Gloeobacter morelensis MG652769]
MAIVCSQCQHANPDTALNCGHCQREIAVLCLECGSINPTPCRYCGECGVELPHVAFAPLQPVATAGEAAVATVPAPSPVPEAPPERRSARRASAAPVDPPLPQVARPMESPPPRPNAGAPPPFASPGTRLQIATAVLVHIGSDERLELPADQPLVYLGKPNEDLPPDIDISHLPGAEVVSRVHAAIHCSEGAFALEDAGSSNGTFLNGELIKPGTRFRRKLKAGDIVALGKANKMNFRFEIEE